MLYLWLYIIKAPQKLNCFFFFFFFFFCFLIPMMKISQAGITPFLIITVTSVPVFLFDSGPFSLALFYFFV